MSETKSTVRLAPYAAASAITCAAGLAASLLMPAAARGAAVWGALAASLGGLCALAGLAAFIGKGVNGVFLGFTIGFLCRAVLVAAGFLMSGVRGNLALVYVAFFFSLYAATQLVEVLFVHKNSRSLSSGATP